MGIAWSIYVTSVDWKTNQQVSILPKKLLSQNDSVGRSSSHRKCKRRILSSVLIRSEFASRMLSEAHKRRLRAFCMSME